MLSFDAQAVEGPRSISVYLQENCGDYTAYNPDYEVNISTSMQSYSITFTMNYPTDSWASLNFELGTSYNDVIIDNVKLVELL